MGKRCLEATAIDDIFRETIGALKCAQASMCDIAKQARKEYDRLSEAVRELKLEVAASNASRDRSERQAIKAGRHLARLARDFERHSEQEIRAAYEAAEKAHVELGAARERESALRDRQGDIERSFANIEALVERSEEMVSEVSAAMAALTGNLEMMAEQWEGIKARYQIGERVIRAQEEERRRVAREIHDGPAQAMANVVLRTEICERLYASGREEVAQELAQLKMLVRECLRELRRIIFNLRPMALDDLGLVPTLKRYLENLREQEGCPVTLSVRGKEARLASMHEVAVFRLVQEAVNNARKHAQASSIQVEISFSGGNYVEIKVEDDGVGFDMERLKVEWIDRESFGLMSMKERIELLDGEFDVVSQLGEGTRLIAKVPFGEARAADEAG